MSAREINLITRRHSASAHQQFVQRMITVWTPVTLVLYVIIVTVVLAYSFFLSSSISGIDAQISAIKGEIAGRQNDEGLYLLLKQKTSSLTQIIKNRYPFSDVFTLLQTFKNQGITIASIKLSEDANIIFEVTVSDSLVLDHFIHSLLDTAVARFNTVELVNLNYQKDGGYTVVLDIGYKQP